MSLAMTKARRLRRPLKASTENDVGYARPPKDHQFKEGQSGNPKGRPKGRKNEATILAHLLHRRITIRENGRPKRITILEAILLRFTEDSLKGNTKSAQFILNRYHSAYGDDREQDTDISKNDEDIIRSFVDRLQKKG